MKIGVLSDTHIPQRAKHLPQALLKGLQDVDYMIHAGDWVSLSVYRILKKYGPVEGVAGNCDGEDIISKFGKKKILQLEGFRIGVMHGEGMKKTTEKRVWDAFAGDKVDLVIFGHTHIPVCKRHKGVWMFNPGSPTDKRRQARYSFGIITLGDEIRAEHVFFDHRH